MGIRHGAVLLLAGGIFLSVLWFSEGLPLQYSHKSAGSAGDTPSATLCLSLVVSLMLLVAAVVLLLNCVTCCKEREINFKEFEDHFDDEIDFTPPAEDTPSMQSPAEVYTLAVSPVPLPGPPHLQPLTTITDASAGFQVGRHSLSYIQEIGNGWFGQVLLSEIYTDPGGTRVVVKELKANASAKEQNDFLQQGDPYRVLQHPNILQCLGQCVEAIPFLLVFEYCEMGDLRGFLSQQDWMFRNAELLQLQRMACEIAAGVTHLHKHNFLHSDLALRNCYLTADLTVKVGDYGIGPYRYKEDYIITEDDVFAPLRWLAPELVGERHGGVVTMEQTKQSNVWALGVTLWELFENAAQPYPHLSDREVLNHVIKEQQVKLFKPQLELPYSERWHEVLQFCWLCPDKRATAEEVHRLLVYLRMQGQKDTEEDFEQRWDALKPNPTARQTTATHSSFPILDQFADDALRQEIDEVLTVTETSRGLSFEYVWEAAKHDHYDGGRPDAALNYHSMFFPVSREDVQAPPALQVFDSHEFPAGSDYYIRLEEQAEESRDYVVLQDVRLDESSTDADFFHQSIDSKDSYLPDSHIWSSLENDSPLHAGIFTEDTAKPDDSPAWTPDILELPERGVNPFRAEALDAPSPPTQKLTDNYSFLREQKLMRDVFTQQNFLLPGTIHEPEESFKMSRWDELAAAGERPGETETPALADDRPIGNGRDDRALDSGFDSTSDRPDAPSFPFSDGGATDSCADANILSLAEDSLSSARLPAQSDELLSEDAELSDAEESFTETNGHFVRSHLLVSGPSLDQISQDSLLEDSAAAPPDVSAQTPDSLDSLDIGRLEPGENKLQPPNKVSDSGYETENLESPEWNNARDELSANPLPPTIVISEAESPAEPGVAGETAFGSSYRDSAYFSDNESEPEKKSEDASASVEAACLRRSAVLEARKEKDLEALFSETSGPQSDSAGTDPEQIGEIDPSRSENRETPSNGEAESPIHAKLTRSYAKEPDMEGRYLGRLDGAEDGADADEEDENSEDSDDEEARAYQLRSSSSDSEDESQRQVPIVISEEPDRNLKSLLKPPRVPPRAQSSRRAVTFFDDVTVYLFDQETPTKDLSDFSNSQVPEFSGPARAASYLNRFANSESSTDEEGGGFEWDDDFPAFRPAVERDPVSKAAAVRAPSWTSASTFSRFSISPASIASFSLTHLTDSDIEQGGSSEDGDKD